MYTNTMNNINLNTHIIVVRWVLLLLCYKTLATIFLIEMFKDKIGFPQDVLSFLVASHLNLEDICLMNTKKL